MENSRSASLGRKWGYVISKVPSGGSNLGPPRERLRTSIVFAGIVLMVEGEVDVSVDEPEQMIFRNVVFDPEVIKERFRPSLLPHHDEQRASTKMNRERHLRISIERRSRALTSPKTFSKGIVWQFSWIDLTCWSINFLFADRTEQYLG